MRPGCTFYDREQVFWCPELGPPAGRWALFFAFESIADALRLSLVAQFEWRLDSEARVHEA
jgi:hypothetical protein